MTAGNKAQQARLIALTWSLTKPSFSTEESGNTEVMCDPAVCLGGNVTSNHECTKTHGEF